MHMETKYTILYSKLSEVQTSGECKLIEFESNTKNNNIS